MGEEQSKPVVPQPTGPSQSEVDAKVASAYMKARAEASAEANAETRRREQETINAMERQKREHQEQQKIIELKAEKRMMETVAENERLNEERKHNMLLAQKERIHHQQQIDAITAQMQAQTIANLQEREKKAEQEKQMLMQQTKERLEEMQNFNKATIDQINNQTAVVMEILNKQISDSKENSYNMMQNMMGMLQQFQESKDKFTTYFQEKPKEDIEIPENIRETVEKARNRLNLNTKDYYNFAIVGHTKTGKSTLINSIRGLKNTDDGAAKVQATEATTEITLYTFNDPKFRFVRIYDVPGAGTLSHVADNYYDDKCLAAFDCLIIVTQPTLGQEEITFAEKSLKYNQPVAFVRSKCDIDIDNERKDRLDDDDDDIDEIITQDYINNYVMNMQQIYAEEIKRSENEELRKIPCFFISSVSLRFLINGKQPKHIFMENHLLDYIRVKSMFARNIID